MKKNKVIILASIIVGVLVVTLGLTYAVISFNETKGNSKLVLGDIWMHYGETNQLVLNDAMPMDINDYTTYKVNPVMVSQELNELSRCVNYFIGNRINNALDEGSTIETFCKGTGTAWDGLTIQEYLDDSQEAAKNDGYDFLEYAGQELLDAGVILQQIENLSYFEFTIYGKNTYTKEDIWYEIVLNHGNEHATRTTRIRDRLLKFTLVEIIDGTEKVLFNNRKYSDLTNRRIWVDTIPANTKEEVNRTYRLYMWISEDTVIGNDNQDYTLDEWNDVYASIKVNVTGDFNEKEVPQDESCFLVGTYDNNGKIEAVIKGYNASCGSNVIIPESIQGYTVSAIGNKHTDIIELLENQPKNNDFNNLIYKNEEYHIEQQDLDGAGAFQAKGLIKVFIPNTIEYILGRAFEDNSIKSITYGAFSKLKLVGNRAFMYNLLENVSIPDSVEVIELSAFSNNKLKVVTIGSGIQYIGASTFEKSKYSNSNLESITFKGKKCEEIKNIQDDWDDKYFPWLSDSSPYYLEGYKVSIYGTDGECIY